MLSIIKDTPLAELYEKEHFHVLTKEEAHLLKNFPLCCDPHSLVRSMKQKFFWNFLAFSMFQQMLPI